jgi:DMSO/TMAO reductase YedYZ molybdopterin-dependent catalytic subunit
MKQTSRMPRRAFITGMASSAGVLLAGCSPTDPPTYGHVLRMGDLLTYKAHRLLLPAQSLAREYDYADISSVPAIGTTNPADPHKSNVFSKEHGPVYERLLAHQFADWRLHVEGSVARPRAFSLDELKRMPSRTQITRHTCEQGWSAIAQWTGVPLRSVLESAGIRPTARFVQFYTYDGWVDGIDMLDALHPQTILAYGMNGRDLPISHGAPLRARVETQLGYKSRKFLRRIVVTDHFDDHGRRGFNQNGWSWYAGI